MICHDKLTSIHLCKKLLCIYIIAFITLSHTPTSTYVYMTDMVWMGSTINPWYQQNHMGKCSTCHVSRSCEIYRKKETTLDMGWRRRGIWRYYIVPLIFHL